MVDRHFLAAGRIWWSYLGRTYPACRAGGYLWALDRPDHPIGALQLGDLVVHEHRRRIVSISRVAETLQTLTKPGEMSGNDRRPQVRRVAVTYIDVREPVLFRDVARQLRAAEPPDGPMHHQVGSGRPGNLYPFNHAALEIVLRATDTHL